MSRFLVNIFALNARTLSRILLNLHSIAEILGAVCHKSWWLNYAPSGLFEQEHNRYTTALLTGFFHFLVAACFMHWLIHALECLFTVIYNKIIKNWIKCNHHFQMALVFGSNPWLALSLQKRIWRYSHIGYLLKQFQRLTFFWIPTTWSYFWMIVFIIFQVATAALSKICIELENDRVSGQKTVLLLLISIC